MNGAAIAKIVLDLVLALAPRIMDLVMDAMSGKDISHDELWQQLPHASRTAAAAAILTEARRAAGLPV